MPTEDEIFRQLLDTLNRRPEAREELRRRLLPGDGTEQALREMAQAQARTEQHLATLTSRVDQLAQAQTRTEERLAILTERLDQLTQRVDQLAARLDQLTQRVDQLAARLDQLTQRVDQLAARMDELAAAQARTEARLADLTEQVRGLTVEVHNLLVWQKGESGLREGERYEEHVGRRAPRMFGPGRGGLLIEPSVREHLNELVADLDPEPDEAHDPIFSDLLWWKDGAYVLAEVSITVHEPDVHRAHDRALTLSRAGAHKGVLQVLPVVVGRGWAERTPRAESVRELADRLGVAWWVGDDVAAPLVEYKRLASGR
jgi:hypothetical protein